MKDAVVGGVQDELSGREVAGDGEARLNAWSVEKELIVIPAKAGGDGRVVEVDRVLEEGGLFKVGTSGGEGEGWGGAGIELCGVGDEVAEVFAEKGVVGVDAGFPLVFGAVEGGGEVEVGFAKVVVLEDCDGCGVGVGVEGGGFVAEHCVRVSQSAIGEDCAARRRCPWFRRWRRSGAGRRTAG